MLLQFPILVQFDCLVIRQINHLQSANNLLSLATVSYLFSSCYTSAILGLLLAKNEALYFIFAMLPTVYARIELES